MNWHRRPISPTELTESVMRRIWAKAAITPSGCVEWTGARSSAGYGAIWISPGTGMARAHRVVLTWALGQDISTRDVDHLCSNRLCVAPSHLELVDHAENIRRSSGVAAPTARAVADTGRCARGHDLTLPGAWVRPQGRNSRQCRECKRDADRRRYAATTSRRA